MEKRKEGGKWFRLIEKVWRAKRRGRSLEKEEDKGEREGKEKERERKEEEKREKKIEKKEKEIRERK